MIKKDIHLTVYIFIYLFFSMNLMAEGLNGKYYNNMTWTDPVQLERLDSTIDFDWNNGSPGGGVNTDHFSVEWTGYIYIPEDANYTFELRHDDQAELIIDGVTVYTYHTWSSNGYRVADPVVLQQGYHSIRATLVEDGGGAEMMIAWTNDVSILRRQIIASNYLFTSIPDISTTPLVEYRMDECYWLGSAHESVKDSSVNGYDASAYNSAAVDTTDGRINFSGYFTVDKDLVETSETTAGNTSGSLSVSFWAKLEQQLGGYAVVLTKSKDWDWNDGWGFVNPGSRSSDTLRFYIDSYSGTYLDSTLTIGDGWTHFTGTYDGDDLRLYKNGVEVAGSPISDNTGITNSSDPMRMAFDHPGDATLNGNLDEVKVWDQALSTAEIESIFNHESAEKNYDGSDRNVTVCEASITANSWTMVGVPIDLRTDTKTVAQTFQGMTGTYDTDWRVYRRDYSDTNNSSWYTYLDAGDSMEFGKGYWLGNALSVAETWHVDGTQAVDYDSSFNGTSDCSANRCVELDVKSASLDIDNGDNLLGTGSYRYNMTGFTGKSPVAWADCRFIIDGIAYTPSAAEAEGISKTIWQYNPGSGANSNGYTTCDDTIPGGCKLEPYKAFWVELHGSTKGKTVKLLIPENR